MLERCGCRQREGRAFQEQSTASSVSAHHITFSCPSYLSVGEGELNREDVYSPKFKSGKKGGNIKICISSIRAVLGRVRAAQSSCMRPSPSCSKHTMEPAAFLGIHTQVMKIPLFSIPAVQPPPQFTAQGKPEGLFSLSPTRMWG